MFNLEPASLVTVIFSVIFLKYAVKIIGKPLIQEKAWQLYTIAAPGIGHTKFTTLGEKKRELAEIDRQRKAISAQDEYAKWTKLNRQFDKLSNEVTELAKETSSERALIIRVLDMVLMFSTTVPIWFSRAWYRKSVLYYFPPGAFPPFLEKILSLSFVVSGGVGLTVWMYALDTVFSSIEFLISFYSQKPVAKPKDPLAKVEEVTTQQ